MSKRAFLDPQTKILKCCGYVESNEAGDIVIDVPEDFILIPGFSRWDGVNWVAYIPPQMVNPQKEKRETLRTTPNKNITVQDLIDLGLI